MITIDIKLTDDRLKNIADEVRSKASALVRRTAFAVEREAKVNAPVDTGFLRNSIYTVTDRGSSYDRTWYRATRALAKRHAGERRSSKTKEWRRVMGLMLDEVDTPGDLTAIVAVGAEYGIHVEYGTDRAAAQPYLSPAVDKARPDWEEGLRELFK